MKKEEELVAIFTNKYRNLIKEMKDMDLKQNTESEILLSAMGLITKELTKNKQTSKKPKKVKKIEEIETVKNPLEGAKGDVKKPVEMVRDIKTGETITIEQFNEIYPEVSGSFLFEISKDTLEAINKSRK